MGEDGYLADHGSVAAGGFDAYADRGESGTDFAPLRRREPMTRDEALGELRTLVGRGEYLTAYDRATGALETFSDDLEVNYLAILALVRSGAHATALTQLDQRFTDASLGRADVPAKLLEDIAALRARIAKDRALATPVDHRAPAAAIAAGAYEAVFDRFGRSYSCINAATLWLLAGDAERSRHLADAALTLTRASTAESTGDGYWLAATEAEAHLLLGDPIATRAALEWAEREAPGDYASRASTRSQLRLICEHAGIDAAVLDPLHTPRVIHFCGHRVSAIGKAGRFPATAEAAVRAEVHLCLDERDVGFGYGSLASGADIIVAEALIARGAELHVTLPFEREEFVAVSVADAGPKWVARFEHCLAAAGSVTAATEGASLDEPGLFSHCANLAMGDAVLRAKNLDTAVEQLAIWDGLDPVNEAGTAVDVGTWRHTGRTGTVIDSRSDLPAAPTADSARSDDDARQVRAMLFADVSGYSSLADAQIPAFVDQVLGPLGTTLEEFANDLRYVNTWGDAIFAVLDSVTVAAECALALQATMRGLDLAAAGLPETVALRIGGHAGPVFSRTDPIRGDANFYGDAVTRAARIEPRTPVGEVYVTHPFAALIALEAPADLACQYAGRLPAAKAYGTFPMYLLTKVNPEA